MTGGDRARPVVLTSCRYFPPAYKGGGPPRSVEAIVESTAELFDHHVVCSAVDLGDDAVMPEVRPNTWTTHPTGARVYYSDERLTPFAWRRLLADVGPDVIYVNSIFEAEYVVPALLGRRRSGPGLVIAPRGELFEGALRKRRRIKMGYLTILRLLLPSRRVFFHASDQAEAETVARYFGSGSRVACAKNIWMSKSAGPPARTLPDLPSLCFVARIAEKKNLLRAVESLEHLQRPVHLNIAGPVDDVEYWDEIQGRIAVLPARATVDYLGPLDPAAVRALLRRSDVFLFPTLGENFGHSIAEALDEGLPVVVGPETPFRVLADEDPAPVRLCDPGSSRHIAETVNLLLDEMSASPAADGRIRLAARTRVAERFVDGRDIDAHAELFRSAAEWS